MALAAEFFLLATVTKPPAKYYNSPETPLFKKSEQLYGIDQARQAGAKAGYLAVVEGYTDVLMAHQYGVCQVVATMGTALTAQNVQQLRRFAQRIVLVFDADVGGNTGVDRALEVFASQEVDLRIAKLPAGQDPCDLLVEKGSEPFVQALANAEDALEFKLNQVFAPGTNQGLETRVSAMDAVLRIIALAGSSPGSSGTVRRELTISRIARRLALKEETVWARLKELEQGQRDRPAARPNPKPCRPRVRGRRCGRKRAADRAVGRSRSGANGRGRSEAGGIPPSRAERCSKGCMLWWRKESLPPRLASRPHRRAKVDRQGSRMARCGPGKQRPVCLAAKIVQEFRRNGTLLRA